MISQTEPHGGEVFMASPPFFRATPESPIRISLWRVLQLPIGKEKKSTLAWFEKLNRAGNNLPTFLLKLSIVASKLLYPADVLFGYGFCPRSAVL